MSKQTLKHVALSLAVLGVALSVSPSLGQSAPQQVAGTGWQALTDTSPAVAIGDGQTEYMAWKGASSNKVYFSVFNGSEWTPQQEVGSVGFELEPWSAETNAAPSLSWDHPPFPSSARPLLWLSWQASNGGAIMFSSWDGANWSSPGEVSGAKTNDPPAFDTGTEFKQLVAWKGASSNSIWFSYTNPIPADLGVGWTDQQKVEGSGWTAESNVAPTLETTFQPSVEDYLTAYLFWKGASSDHIWGSYTWGSYDAFNNTTTISGWSQQTEISCNHPQWAAETDASPAAAALGRTSDVVVWKGSSDNTLWYTYDGNSGSSGLGCQWAHQRTVSGGSHTPFGFIGGTQPWSAETNVAPALAFSIDFIGGAIPNVAILAWKNATDNTIWFLNPTTLPGLSGLEP